MEFIRLENQKMCIHDDKQVLLDFSKYENQNVLIRNLRTRDSEFVRIMIVKLDEEFGDEDYSDVFRDNPLVDFPERMHKIRDCLSMKYNTTPSFHRGVNPDDSKVYVRFVKGTPHVLLLTYEVYKVKIPTPTAILRCTIYDYSWDLPNIIGVVIDINPIFYKIKKHPRYFKLKKYPNLVFIFKKKIHPRWHKEGPWSLFYQRIDTLDPIFTVNEIEIWEYYYVYYWSYDD